MRFLTKIFVLSLLLLISGCFSNSLLKETTDSTDCDLSDCQRIAPTDGVLYIYFTRSFQQPNPDILLLNGYWEDQKILDTIPTDTVPAYKDFVQMIVPLDHYYTAAAVYLRDQDTIYAIDGAFVSKSVYYVCDTPCWEISNNKLNVKLKNF